jgi:hypothetical protein
MIAKPRGRALRIYRAKTDFPIPELPRMMIGREVLESIAAVISSFTRPSAA